MIRPHDWNSTPAYDGSYKSLPANGYVCSIKEAHAENGNYGEQLVLALEISDGEYSNYFGDIWERKKKQNPSAKWPCVFYQSTTTKGGATNGFYKGLIKSIEESNPGYVWNFDEYSLKGKKVGFVFREEEWMTNNGETRTNTKPNVARSVQAIRDGDFTVSPLKKLESKPAQASASYDGFAQAVDEEDLPF